MVSREKAAKVLLNDLSQYWDKPLSTKMDNARVKSKRDGHGYSVVDRESFRAVLQRISEGDYDDA